MQGPITSPCEGTARSKSTTETLMLQPTFDDVTLATVYAGLGDIVLQVPSLIASNGWLARTMKP